MASAITRHLIQSQTSPSSKLRFTSSAHQPINSRSLAFTALNHNNHRSLFFSGHRSLTGAVKSSRDVVSGAGDGEGVSLGTMKLPLDTDIPRFETLLFQWANSLCQGAQLPLPLPLKVDKIEGGVRLGFVTIEDGKTDVPVYIDCVVIEGSNESSSPMFKATRNGARKDKVPPGEPRIMKSLLAALRTSAEIARV